MVHNVKCNSKWLGKKSAFLYIKKIIHLGQLLRYKNNKTLQGVLWKIILAVVFTAPLLIIVLQQHT